MGGVAIHLPVLGSGFWRSVNCRIELTPVMSAQSCGEGGLLVKMKLWGIKPQHLIEKNQIFHKELLGLIHFLGFIIFIFKHFFPLVARLSHLHIS